MSVIADDFTAIARAARELAATPNATNPHLYQANGTQFPVFTMWSPPYLPSPWYPMWVHVWPEVEG